VICCDRCLRRSILLGVMAPLIEVAAADAPGKRTPELLALEDRDLAEAIAPRHADKLIKAAREQDIGELRASMRSAAIWACCRHEERYYPAPLLGDPQSPPALLGRGDPDLLGELALDSSVTVVGSRRPSSYGREVAHSLAGELASAGLTVISGMAMGIDSRAHEGTLDVGGRTVAVLGGGPDVVYPPRSGRLYGRIVENGLVVSELPPGTRPHRWSFPARNRIMAALGRITVVVEAAAGSGSLITARMAADLGRDVGAVPGRIGTKVAEGTNGLLADGAIVVRGAQDVLDAMLGAGAPGLEPRMAELSSEQAAILDLVERGHETPDAVATASGMPVAEAIAALSALELLGRVSAGASGRYVAAI
jgi:DNA processing protein